MRVVVARNIVGNCEPLCPRWISAELRAAKLVIDVVASVDLAEVTRCTTTPPDRQLRGDDLLIAQA